MTKQIHVETNVKDENLIEARRQQIITAAIQLFREKGFHRTTTREIATCAGFSIGTLYEYIRSKDDVLYLVCDSIYHKVQQAIVQFDAGDDALETLVKSIEQYFQLIDTMQEEMMIMYQETKSLPKPNMRYILSKELEMVQLFEQLLKKCVEQKVLDFDEQQCQLTAQQIAVQGQSWAFRKWAYKQQYTIEQFTNYYIQMLLHGARYEMK